MLTEAESCAHAAGANVRYSCATNVGSDANLFHYPVTLGSLADLSSDSEVEIIEAIGMQISSLHTFICILISYCTLWKRTLFRYLTLLVTLWKKFIFFVFHAMSFYRNPYLAQEAEKQDELWCLAAGRARESFQEDTVSGRFHQRGARSKTWLTRVESSGEKIVSWIAKGIYHTFTCITLVLLSYLVF